MSDQQVQHQLWSIERVVAFLVAPIATPLSGFIAAWLAKHGINIKGDAIYAFAGSASLGAAGSFITWLVGRQKFVAHTTALESSLGRLSEPLVSAIPVSERESLLKEIEGIVSGYTARVAKHIEGVVGSPDTGSMSPSIPVVRGATTVSGAPLDPWQAPNDPAPAPAPVAAPEAPATTEQGQPSGADAGAAITGS